MILRAIVNHRGKGITTYPAQMEHDGVFDGGRRALPHRFLEGGCSAKAAHPKRYEADVAIQFNFSRPATS